jgi:hypothetical protein
VRYNQGEQPMVFEVTCDENVMWEFVNHARFETL